MFDLFKWIKTTMENNVLVPRRAERIKELRVHAGRHELDKSFLILREMAPFLTKLEGKAGKLSDYRQLQFQNETTRQKRHPNLN